MGRELANFLHTLRILSPLALGFVIGSFLSLAVFPGLQNPDLETSSERDCPPLTGINDGVQEDDPTMYEAIIHQPLPGNGPAPSTGPVRKTKVPRPRFYATELGIKDKLFVGVLTSKETLPTNAVALNLTASHHVNKMVFFSQGPIEANPNGGPMNVVGMITSLKPHLEIFHILEHIGKTVVKNYDWFFLIPDSTYIKAFKLFEFVSHISISHPTLVGRKLPANPQYCDFNAGILISQDVMRSLVENIQNCRKMADEELTTSENLGACITKFANLTCKEEWKGKQFRALNLDEKSLEEEWGKPERKDAFSSLLSLHPLQHPSDFYFIHHKLCIAELDQLSTLTHSIQEEIKNITRDAGVESPSWPAGVPSPARPKTRYEAFTWDFFTETEMFQNDGGRNRKPLTGIDLKDVHQVIEAGKDRVLGKFPEMTFQGLISGYRKFDPTRGMDYVLDLEFTLGQRKMSKRVHLIRPISRVELVPVPYVTEVKEVRIVLPIQLNQVSAAIKFIRRFAAVCMDSSDSSRLTVVLITNSRTLTGAVNQEFLPVIQEIRTVREQYGHAPTGAKKTGWIQILKMKGSDKLTSAEISNGVIEKVGGENLFLIVSPWVELHLEFLNRVRMNTIQGFQVFFPVPFLQFNPIIVKYSTKDGKMGGAKHHRNGGRNRRKNGPPELESIDVHKTVGRFEAADFSVASFYGADFLYAMRKARSMAVDHSKWEGIVQLFLLPGIRRELHIIRAVDPALRIAYHERFCDPDLQEEDYGRCLVVKKEGLASRAQLATLVLNQKRAELRQN